MRPLAIASTLALVVVASAWGAWGGKDPARNTPIGLMPSACDTAPTGSDCINAAVWYLDKARSRSGLPPYALPADFVSLSPTRQIFVLANLDRVAYGLHPITGITAALSHDALVTGVWRADDPHLTHTSGVNTWWPGWAGAFINAPLAYEAWVWDDGLGSHNPRCTSTDHSRCWGHRHSVLWKYGPVLAMGAAAGKDSHHHRGYAYLFIGANSGYTPRYTYTWKEASADGAGTNAYDPGPAPPAMCHVPAAIGLMLHGAERAIEKGHCTVGEVIKVHSDYVPGMVFRQSPAPFKVYPRGTSIRLKVSLG